MAGLAEASWTALVLAAGRGPDDPVARAYSVSHKCLVEIAGKPMLARVVEALSAHPTIADILISIDDRVVAEQALGILQKDVTIMPSRQSAAASAAAGLEAAAPDQPVLLTTADHPLLDRAMLDRFLEGSLASRADITVGLTRAETILAAYPSARRTFLRLGPDSVSGCNLYGLMTPRAATAIEFWKRVEQDRKRPWRLIAAFGIGPLLRYLTGRVDLEAAFVIGSRRLGIEAKPVIIPFAEAAIDVDKPADKELCDAILGRR